MKSFIYLIAAGLIFFSTESIKGHCDTMDGPVVADAKKALESGNVNYVLKWVHAESEAEIKDVFNLAMKVRKLNSDAQLLADKYFYETLVRLHRNGEGVTYTGVKPSGTPVDEKIKAADESIEIGNLTPLEKLLTSQQLHELEEPFAAVMSLKNYDINDVKSGRAFVEAYVRFFHMAEGEVSTNHEHQNPHAESM